MNTQSEVKIEGNAISLANVLSALSYALDLTEGQPMGHAFRTCHLALRIGEAVKLDEEQNTALYYAALMKDAGMSSIGARMYRILGGSELSEGSFEVIDWTNLAHAAHYALQNRLPLNALLQKSLSFSPVGADSAPVSDEYAAAKRTQGGQIALKLGFGEDAAEAVATIDERWDGNGEPYRLREHEIPPLGAILGLAQTIEVLCAAFGKEAAYQILEQRARSWFDPVLVKQAMGFADERAFWETLYRSDQADELIERAPSSLTLDASDETIDRVCEAFSDIIDAKSSFTGQHSRRVCAYACQMGAAFGFDEERLTILRRASLLHDVGKLGVPLAILEKPGPLTDEEFTYIKHHPFYSEQILQRINGFERVTAIAAAHHEKLDGSGYFRGLTADEIDLDMRILTVADIFDALSAARPYRGAMPLPKVFAILEEESQKLIDPNCVRVLKSIYGEQEKLAA